MDERENVGISEIGREFFVRGPVPAVCQPRGFNRWCTLPYPDHKDGCPNFGKRADCPPFAPYFLDAYKPEVRIAFMRFDFEEYLKRKREIHPDWTERALVNPRHFQGHIVSKFKEFVRFQTETPEYKNYQAIYSPEAMGVNVHLTVRGAGVELEWPPRKEMYRIALLAESLTA